MATSGTYNFSPTIGDILSVAFRRVRIDPDTLDSTHIQDAVDALNFVYIEMEGEDGTSKFRYDYESITTTASEMGYVLPVGTIDVMQMVKRTGSGSSQTDIPIQKVSREDYINLAPKNSESSVPSQYTVIFEKPLGTEWFASDPGVTDRPAIVLWPVPDSVFTLEYIRIRSHQDVTAITETLDTRRNWYPAVLAGVTAYLAQEYDHAREDKLMLNFERLMKRAQRESRDRTPVMMYGSRRNSRRRRAG